MAAFGVGLSGLVAQARRAAQRRGQRLSTAHVLLVMLQSGGEIARLLAARGVRESDLLSALKVVDDEPHSALEVALERAYKLAAVLGEDDVLPIHLLLSITRDPRTSAHRCLEQIGTSASALREQVMAVLGVDVEPAQSRTESTQAPERTTKPEARSGRARLPILPRRVPTPPAPKSPTPASTNALEEPPREPTASATASDATLAAAAPPIPAPEKPARAAEPPRNHRVAARAPKREPIPDGAAAPYQLDPEVFPVLAALGRNLTAAAAVGLIDPVVGREREVEMLLDVLARRRSNNPLLVGPPGVGKTAIVEGLALRLAKGGDGVRGLEGRVLIELSAGALVSGTGVRGALAERLRQIREEVARSDGRVLLFIDEIHAVLGGSDSPDDLANELKTSLARGELPCIGATTDAEHRRCFERDPALARRFSRVDVGQPTPEDALRILRGIASRYEIHHAVAYEPEALEAAVGMSVRYLPEQQLPDKAIGIIDLAAARVRRRGGRIVDVEAVASVVAEQARVSVDRLLVRDADRLLELEKLLADRIVGHEDAMRRIADALRKGAAGFRGKRPLGTFLLLGPTGVGKTETAKAISDVFFPGVPITRLDMSEMSEAHAVARLLGAPPGYVGHDEGGQLTEAVRRRPHQLILLDEIEKAHPEVLLALLPLLDEGRLTDGRGRTVDFTNTIVLMTSNLGASPAAQPAARIGFGTAEDDRGERVREGEAAILAARRALPPELWNRIDEPLWFGALTKSEVATIARRMLAHVGATLLSEQGVRLEVDDASIDALVAGGGWDAALGARPMRRTIGRLVESPLASSILSGEIVRGDVVRLVAEGGALRIEREDAIAAEE